MTYAIEGAGRVAVEASDCGRAGFWTFAAVEERLIEAMDLWRRSPGGGKWPFASDAPWQWMTRRTRITEGQVKGMELTRLLQADDAEETRMWQGRDRPRPLSRDEVALRDETTEWLGWVVPDARKVVVEVVKQRMSGRTNVDWARVKRAIGAELGNKGVYRRYQRAIEAIAKRLNAGGA